MQWSNGITVTRVSPQLNYYKVKSQDEWLERSQQGEGASGTDNLEEFYLNDWNEVEDSDILKFLPELRENLGLTKRDPQKGASELF